jgi:hypothetical protein
MTTNTQIPPSRQSRSSATAHHGWWMWLAALAVHAAPRPVTSEKGAKP